MVCRNCGRAVPEGADACAYCGLPSAIEPPPKVHSYLAEAVFVTFLFFPFGIVSIVYAAQVSSFLARGDVVRAKKASGMARTWMFVSIWTGGGLILLAALALLLKFLL